VKSVADPIVIPAEIGAESAELAEGVSVGGGPPSAGFFEAGLEVVAVAAFDETRADGQIEREGAGITSARWIACRRQMGIEQYSMSRQRQALLPSWFQASSEYPIEA
jgi:hypothetical protein